jgi:predicted methyltransferase
MQIDGGYIRDIFRVLKPGGWCQIVEIYFNAQSDNGTLTPGKSGIIIELVDYSF